MPSSILSDLLAEVFKGVIEMGCYYVGRVVVPVVSFGRWKCDRLTADVPRQKLRKAGTHHLRGQRIYLTVEATTCVGFLFLALVIGGGFLIWYLARDST